MNTEVSKLYPDTLWVSGSTAKALKRRGLSLATLFLLLTACTPELTDDPIPPVTFADVSLNLSLIENISLNSNGGSRDLGSDYPEAGLRGIIVYRKNSTTYLAFEKNCSYQPNEACATVSIHASTFFMEDVCCGSTFNFEGDPTGGPAWRPLRQYLTLLVGNELTITDEVVE